MTNIYYIGYIRNKGELKMNFAETINGYSVRMKFGCFVCEKRYTMDFVSGYTITQNRHPMHICAKCILKIDVVEYRKKYSSFKKR